MNPTRRVITISALVTLVTALPVPAASRFEPVDHALGGAAEWVSASGERIAFGSDTQIYIAQPGPPVVVERQIGIGQPVRSGVLVEQLLYLGGTRGLSRIDLARGNAAPVAFDLDPPVRGPLHLAQMDDYLVVAEDGYGLRILSLPAHGRLDAPGCAEHAAAELAPVSALPLDQRFRGVAASARKIYLVDPDGTLTVVEARRPDSPAVVRRVPAPGGASGIAANGDAVYLVGPAGLSVLDLAAEEPRVEGPYADLAGPAIDLAGRTTYLALGAAGLATLRDTRTTTANFNVSVGNNFFNPQGITITQGDSVTWQKPNTAPVPHNVRSCVAAQTGCAGATAAESFTSGSTTTAAFNFAHTFTVVGSDPYVCQQHANLGMTGSVTVQASAPPAVPGLSVGKVTPDGSRLELDWLPDCSSTEHFLITGSEAQLPAAPGGVYGVGGSVCGIGSPVFVWNGVPLPASDQYLWFLVLARAGNTEGSWGTDSFGQQRDGAGTGGSSGQCTIGGKSASNTCGQ